MPLMLVPVVTGGPFAWDGLFNYYISLGSVFTWYFVTCFYTFNAIRKIEHEEHG
jgi:hypothetical protein